MNRITLSIMLSAGVAFAASAGAPFGLLDQALVNRTQFFSDRSKTAMQRLGARTNQTVNNTVSAFLKLNDGHAADELIADGFQVLEMRGGFAAVVCTPDQARKLSAHEAVAQIEFNRKSVLKLDRARAIGQVDNVTQGLDLPKAYTGKGVIAAIVDGGFDPNHINFLKEDGSSRIKYFQTVEVTPDYQVRITPYTGSKLKTFTTDDETQTHGTHTMGIMAGGYKGNLKYAQIDRSNNTINVNDGANPYCGIASDSEIYASSGTSQDALIAYAIDGLLAQRYDDTEDHYKPVVLNLSLGGNQGSHDGTSMISQYIKKQAIDIDKAIVCIAVGNEGDMPIAYHKTFTAEDNTVKTFIRPYVYTDFRQGTLEIYSDTEQPLKVSLAIFNGNRNYRTLMTIPAPDVTETEALKYYCSSADYQYDDSFAIDANLAKAYEGYYGIGSMIDTNNGRHYTVIDYALMNSDTNLPDDQTVAQYTVGIIVEGVEGQRVDIFCDGSSTAIDSYGVDGFVSGMTNGTITDMATTQDAVVVGAYNCSERVAGLKGTELGYESGLFPEGDVTYFSSYGTLVDGRELPHVTAPGALVVSSISTYYENAYNASVSLDNRLTVDKLSARYTGTDRNSDYMLMVGTSMASPYVAGVVALWLEANPDLTPAEVIEILQKTAVKSEGYSNLTDPVQGGAGVVNAYEGLKEVIRRSGVDGVIDDSADRVLFEPVGDRSFKVFLGGSEQMDVRIYSLDGKTLLTSRTPGDEALIDASSLSVGIYLVSVNNRTQKVVFK